MRQRAIRHQVGNRPFRNPQPLRSFAHIEVLGRRLLRNSHGISPESSKVQLLPNETASTFMPTFDETFGRTQAEHYMKAEKRENSPRKATFCSEQRNPQVFDN